MDHKVEISQEGRGGAIVYRESGGSISFGWEFSTVGVIIFVPAPAQWDAACRDSQFSGGAGRRDEILERTGREVCGQKTGTFEISDNFIDIIF